MPLTFVGFLDQCARLILLKKVGGGYIFTEMTPSRTAKNN